MWHRINYKKMKLLLNVVFFVSGACFLFGDHAPLQSKGGDLYFVTAATLPSEQVRWVTSLQEGQVCPFVLSLPGGVVVNEGAIITKDGCILEDIRVQDPGTMELGAYRHSILNKDKRLAFRGKLAVISSSGSENWYHWFLQILPRLIILEKSGVAYDSIYVNNMIYPWQERALGAVLSFLRISKDKMLVINGDVSVKASMLIVPSVPFIPSKGVGLPQWMIQTFREIFLGAGGLERIIPSEKIYISRLKAPLRRIVNEDDYCEILKAWGFKIVHLETITPFEQAALFNRASVIVAAHGSGLSNLIFSRPGCKVIEIDQHDERRGCFRPITHSIGGTFIPFYARPMGDPQTEDMEVCVPELLALLAKV